MFQKIHFFREPGFVRSYFGRIIAGVTTLVSAVAWADPGYVDYTKLTRSSPPRPPETNEVVVFLVVVAVLLAAQWIAVRRRRVSK
jgi:hypothetical protein